MRKAHCRKDGCVDFQPAHPLPAFPSLRPTTTDALVARNRALRLVWILVGWMDGSLMSHWANLPSSLRPSHPSLAPFGVRKYQGKRESRPAFVFAPSSASNDIVRVPHLIPSLDSLSLSRDSPLRRQFLKADLRRRD